MWDYARLKGRIRESGTTQEDLGRKIGLTPATFSLKLNNKAEFKHNEIENICIALNIPPAEIPSYFFTHQV